MTLEPDDYDDFNRIHRSLLRFIAGKKKLKISAEEIEYIDVNLTKELCDTFSEDAETLADAYISKNPDQFSKQDLAVVNEWKNRVSGRFILFRQLKKYAVLIGAEEHFEGYGVVGLVQPLADLTSNLPVMIDITLLPFRGMLVYDGIMVQVPVLFGGSGKKLLNEQYKELKAGPGITTYLGPPPKKKAKLKPSERVNRLAKTLAKKLKKNRDANKQLKEFEDNILPVFKAWIEETFGEQRAKLNALRKEVEELEELCDEVEFARDCGDPIQVDDFDAFIEAAIDLDDDNDDDDLDDEAERPELNDIPDFILESMFAEMMESVRGIDISKLSKKDYNEAWDQFKESLEHAQSGDKNAFEKAMFQVGADKSDDNVSAVKKAFRKLARKLHPDRNPDFGEVAQELWNELKASKEALDLKSIEQIDIQWRLIQGESFSAKEESNLKEIQISLDEEWYEIKGSLNYYHDHPMWNKEVGDKPSQKIKKQIAKDIREETIELEDERNYLRRELEEMTRKRKPKAKKKTASKKAKKKSAAKKKTTKKAANKKTAKKKQAKEAEESDTEQMTFDF